MDRSADHEVIVTMLTELVATTLLAPLTAFALWCVFTEGSYIAPYWVKRVYAGAATTYESKWAARPYTDPDTTERLFLAPLRAALHDDPRSRLMDVGCGTGRISMLVIRQPWFEGRILAVDQSEQMLERFRQHAATLPATAASRLQIVNRGLDAGAAGHDGQYQAIAMTEVGELLPNFASTVVAISQARAPGGLFLTTKPPDRVAWLFFGRSQTTAKFRSVLSSHGFENVTIHRWRARYDVVHAYKARR